MSRRARIKPDWSCMDCEKDTLSNHEHYVLTDRLWRLANPLIVGMLCLGCVERRLGRDLHAADFAADSINAMNAAHCQLLANRLRRAPANSRAGEDVRHRTPIDVTPRTAIGRASAALLPHRGEDGRVPLEVMVGIMREHRFISGP